eukprot:4285118-Pyramimonas_sp.AAC.1
MEAVGRVTTGAPARATYASPVLQHGDRLRTRGPCVRRTGGSSMHKLFRTHTSQSTRSKMVKIWRKRVSKLVSGGLVRALDPLKAHAVELQC